MISLTKISTFQVEYIEFVAVYAVFHTYPNQMGVECVDTF